MPQLEVATIIMKDAVNVLIGRAKEGPDAGKWIIPSGYVKEGEHLVDASQRLTIEETGIVIKPKQILFLSKEGPDAGKWIIPSGYVKEGEHLVDASQRLTIEETGIVIKPKQILFLSEVVEPNQHQIAVFCFGEYV